MANLADENYHHSTGSNNHSLNNESLCSSWDEIDESDYKLASWVPDYYVTHCQGCNNKFSYRLRKHHCRNCGQVFCYKCADQFYPLPKLNLNAPVRVCYTCKISLERQLSGASCSSNGSHSNNANSRPRLNSGGAHLSMFSSTPPFADLQHTINANNNSNQNLNSQQRNRLLNPMHHSGEAAACYSQNADMHKFKKNIENNNPSSSSSSSSQRVTA